MKQSAAQKVDDIWSQVSKDTAHTSAFPNAVELMGLFTESINPTFDQKGDAMPAGVLYGTRRKYIHSVGVVGKFKFNSYTQFH